MYCLTIKSFVLFIIVCSNVALATNLYSDAGNELNMLLKTRDAAYLQKLKLANQPQGEMIDLLYNNKIDKSIMLRPTSSPLVIAFLETGLKYESFWKNIDTEYYENLKEIYKDNQTISLLCSIILKLRHPERQYDRLEVPALTTLSDAKIRFFYGIYICNNLQNKQLCWKYFYSSTLGVDSIINEYKDLLQYVYSGSYDQLLMSQKVYYRLKDLKDAQKITDIDISLFTDAIRSNDPIISYYLGALFFRQKKYDKSKKSYSLAVKFIPGYSRQIGDLFDNISDRKTAIDFYRIAIAEGDKDAYLLLSLLFSNANDPEVYDLATGTDIAREGWEVGQEMCRFVLAANLVSENKISFQEALDMIGNISAYEHSTFLVNWVLGDIYKHFGMNKEAIKYFQKADTIYEKKDLRPKKKLLELYRLENNDTEAQKLMLEIKKHEK